MEHYMVWGIVPGTDFYSKLQVTKTRKRAEKWKERNKKYYDDMRIYLWQEDHSKRYNPNDNWEGGKFNG